MARRCSPLGWPIDQDASAQRVGSPAAFRGWLDRAFREAPELSPAAVARGDRLPDARTSRRLGLRLRRVRPAATGASYPVRPSVALPDRTGLADAAEGPRFR